MTREEFLSLPPTVALRVLLDAFPSLEQKLAAVPKPELPKRPRFDFPIYRRDGIAWASECDSENLSFWRKRYQESADKGGQYAAKDAKRVKAIDAWIAWRGIEPGAAWSGKRNDEAVTAAPPSDRPRVHPRAGSSAGASESGGTASNDSGGIGENY